MFTNKDTKQKICALVFGIKKIDFFRTREHNTFLNILN